MLYRIKRLAEVKRDYNDIWVCEQHIGDDAVMLRRLINAAVGEPVGRNANWSVSVSVGVVTGRMDRGTAERQSTP